MRKSSIILFILFLMACHNNTQFLKEVKKLPAYPSASAIEYAKGSYYIMGDDATHLLVLDSNFVTTDSIPVFPFPEKRIPKNSKPDIEAMTWVSPGQLLLAGSGSLDTIRNQAVLFNNKDRQLTFLRLDTFYHRLKQNGLPELNIEGICSIPGNIILSNRGHKGSPQNHLIFTSRNFWEQQTQSPIAVIRIGTNPDSTVFNGVSGMTYVSGGDKLILTISTEDTRSVYEDGAIGKSYLWIVDNISSKKKWSCINPDRIIDLDATDSRFKGQKVESVTLLKETSHFIQLTIAADNDDGSSTLFRLDVSRK
jgi:hypothetical protein